MKGNKMNKIVEQQKKHLENINKIKDDINNINIELKTIIKNIEDFENIEEYFNEIFSDNSLDIEEQNLKLDELQQKSKDTISKEQFEIMCSSPKLYIQDKLDELNDLDKKKKKCTKNFETLNKKIEDNKLEILKNPENNKKYIDITLEQEHKKEEKYQAEIDKLDELKFNFCTQEEQKFENTTKILSIYGKENINLADKDRNDIFRPMYLAYIRKNNEYEKLLNSGKNNNKTLNKLKILEGERNKYIAELTDFMPDVLENRKELEQDKLMKSLKLQEDLALEKQKLRSDLNEYRDAKIDFHNQDKDAEKDKDKDSEPKLENNEDIKKEDIITDNSDINDVEEQKQQTTNKQNEDVTNTKKKFSLFNLLFKNKNDKDIIDNDLEDIEEDEDLDKKQNSIQPKRKTLLQKLKEKFKDFGNKIIRTEDTVEQEKENTEKKQEQEPTTENLDIKDKEYYKELVEKNNELSKDELSEFFDEKLQKNIDDYIDNKDKNHIDVSEINNKYRNNERNRDEQEVENDLER